MFKWLKKSSSERTDNDNEKILTSKNIRKFSNLNEEMIKEYCRLGEENLRDCLATKKQIEQKSFILLTAYITISIALFGYMFSHYSTIVFLSACCLCVGIILLLISIKFSNYGCLGRNTEDWLNGKEYITITKENQAFIFSDNLIDLANKINQSDKSNNAKIKKVTQAIYWGIAATFLFGIKALFSLLGFYLSQAAAGIFCFHSFF